MFDRANVDLVGSLHLIGRRLAVLKRIYQSYDLIINRVLQRQRTLREEARMRADATSALRNDPDDDPDYLSLQILQQSSMTTMTATGEITLGVRLSAAAIVRFERLLDRIRLYALSEIDECLAEKESLVFLVGLNGAPTMHDY